MRAALRLHQPHPDWLLYIASALYLLAQGRGKELEPPSLTYLSDFLEIAREDAEREAEALENL